MGLHLLFRPLSGGDFLDVHTGGGEGKVQPVGPDNVHDVQVQVVLHLVKDQGIGGPQVGRHQQIDAGRAKAGQLHNHRFFIGVGAGGQHGPQVFHQLFQLGPGGAVLHPQGEAVEALLALGGVVDGGGADVAVGQDVDRVVQGPHPGGTETDVLHRALHAAHHDPVADLEGPLNQNHHAAEQIAGGVLGGQGDGQAYQARAGDDAGDRQAPFLHRHQDTQNRHHHFVHLHQNVVKGLVGADFLPGARQHQVGELGGPVQAPAQQQNDGEAVQFQQEGLHGLGGVVGDIGKVRVPEQILNKKTNLSEYEMAALKRHPEYAGQVLQRYDNISEDVVNIIYQHHECCDGSGYPSGINAQYILKSSKVLAIAEAYNTMLTYSPEFPRAFNNTDAIKKIYAEAGKKYQADIVKTFVSIMGVYPVGTAVTLSNGAIGIVCEVNKQDQARPKILMMSKDNPEKIELVNLKTHQNIKIVKEINNTELNINPFEIFNSFLQNRISHQVQKA